MTPRKVMLSPRRRAICGQQRIDHPAGVSSIQDLPQKRSAVQRAEVPDECQTVPEPVCWNGVVLRWRCESAPWSRGGNHGSWGFQGTTTTSRAGHSRIRWSSWGSMAEGGKRYKDLKVAQSILRQSTATASGWGKADTQWGRRWLIGDAIRSTSSRPAQRRIAPNANWGSVYNLLYLG